MSIEITHLGSGSKGNAALLSSGDSRALIDCGFSLRQTEKRLSLIGVDPGSIDTILVTHHHKDHSGSALNASKSWGAKLHCNLETAMRLGWRPLEDCRTFSNLERVECATGLSLITVPVPHDDAENVAVIASDREGGRVAIVTDLGETTAELEKHLRGCNHISIEANYDYTKLIQGPYPDSLKRRISGRGGHLSNTQTAELLGNVCHSGLDSIVLCHLSEKNNAPHLAESEVLMTIGDTFSGDISVSKQSGPEFSHWTGNAGSRRFAAA